MTGVSSKGNRSFLLEKLEFLLEETRVSPARNWGKP